VKLWSH